MKKDIHPDYREVLFHDLTSGHEFVTRSSQRAEETKSYKGKEYPYIKIEISHMSHPFYTGKAMLIDSAGRIDKYYKKYGKK